LIDDLIAWARLHPVLLDGALVCAVAVSLGTLIGVPMLIARLPDDYFAGAQAPAMPWASRHPALRLVLRVLKNLGGLLLLLAGTAMLVLPGQGLLTILAGLLLLDFPGKRRLERALVRKPRVRRALDWVRGRAGSSPLIPPGEDRVG
jgi:uncharacterized iron-regulated membrane protein